MMMMMMNDRRNDKNKSTNIVLYKEGYCTISTTVY
jgi:hypothetical protein